MRQVNEAAEVIYDLVDPTANLIFGAVVDPRLGQEVSITLIATGFGTGTPVAAAPAAAERQAPAEPAQAERCADADPELHVQAFLGIKSAVRRCMGQCMDACVVKHNGEFQRKDELRQVKVASKN